MFDKRGKVALELHSFDNLVHLAPDTFDFGEARLVDFFGRKVKRREPTDTMPVELTAIGQRRRADVGPAARDVLLGHKLPKPLVRRDHAGANGLPSSFAKSLVLRFRNRRRRLVQRLVQQAGGGIVDDVRIDRILPAFENHCGLGNAFAQALPHDCHVTIGVVGEGVETGDVVLEILGRVKRYDLVKLREFDVKPGPVANRSEVCLEFVLG